MADYKILTIPFARDAVPDMVNNIPETPSPSEPQLASYRQGFPVITTIPLVAGGLPPEGQDFNGIFLYLVEVLNGTWKVMKLTYSFLSLYCSTKELASYRLVVRFFFLIYMQ